jgi:hypothetical protein
VYGAILNKIFDSIRHSNDNSISRSIWTPKRYEWWQRNVSEVVIGYFVFVNLLLVLIMSIFKYKAYQMTFVFIMSDLIFLGLVYIGIVINQNRKDLLSNPILIAIFLLVFVGHRIGTYRIHDAQKIKDGKSEFKLDHMAFKYKDSLITTDNNTLYIGETSTHIFLYNRRDSSTNVYPLAVVENLKIK